MSLLHLPATTTVSSWALLTSLVPSGGVPEHTDWHDDVEQDLARSLACLMNLAYNDFQNNFNSSINDYFAHRLQNVLATHDREWNNHENPTLQLVNVPSLRELLQRVDLISARVNQLRQTVSEIKEGIINLVERASRPAP